MLARNVVLLIFTCFSLTKNIYSANVLYIGAVASPSHYIWNKALALGLVAKGHNVTLVAPDVEKNPMPTNFTRIVLDGVYDELLQGDEFSNFNDFVSMGPNDVIKMFFEWCSLQSSLSLKSSGAKQLMAYPNDFKFDIILFDVTAGVGFLPIMKKFNYPPAIAVTAFLLPTYVSFDYANLLSPSYIPWHALPYSSEMTIWQRMRNTYYTYLETFLWQNQYQKAHETWQSLMADKDIPPMPELIKRISLVVANSDPVFDFAHTVPPNFILVGGLHARKGKKLPDDLQNVLDNAKHGVIVFSLGTNLRSDKLGEVKIKALLEAFSKIKQTVLWKFESDFTNLPKNVIVRKWLPQNDLISHPNVRLFIGHGGALSSQESVYHGVPIIVIPFLFDQHINAKNIIKKNLGLKMDEGLLESSNYILNNLKEILNNPIYAENAKKASRTLLDRLETPMERAVFWIEYVIRNKGAEYLQSPMRSMKYYEATNADIILILLVAVLTVLCISCKLIKTCCKIFSSKSMKVKVN